MKRPFAWPCALFVAGIILAEVSGWRFTVFLPGGFLLVLGALTWTAQRQVLLALGIIAGAAAALALQTRVVGPQDLRTVAGGKPHIVTVRGRLVESPYQRFYEERARFLTKLDCEQLRFERSEWQPVAGTIGIVSSGTPARNLWHGQIVEVKGVLAEPEAALAPGLFDYREYLRRIGIYHVLRVSSEHEWRVTGSSEPPVTVRFNAWAKKTLAHGLPAEDDALRLLWAMTLGWKTALSGEVAEPFMRSGTLHVFAISGLHIVMIAAIIAGVLRGCGVPRRACALILIPAIWFYTAATGWQSSAVRSAVMATVFYGSWLLVRPPDLFNSLAAAALIILVCDPQQLFQAGFQLSFAVVFCLALVGNAMRPYQEKIAAGDPLIPWEVRPWWQRAGLRSASYMTGMAMTAVAAWLGSIPLIAYYFHLITPVSVISNLLVVPMSGAALASNLASLFFGAWCPFATDVLNNSAWFWMKAMLWVSEWTARWPGAAMHMRAPGFFTIAFYYAVLITIAARLFKNPRWRTWSCVVILLLGIGAGIQESQTYSRSTLTVLPLDDGHAVFADLPGSGRDVLIDCGNKESARITIKPFLQASGTTQLSNLILTHGDVEHVGGLETMLNCFAPERVVVPAVAFLSPVYRQGMRMLGERSINLAQLASGESVADWTILYPAADEKFPQADDKAFVLRAKVRGTSVLLLTDLSLDGQNALIERAIELRSDIVIASNPRAGEPACDALLDLIEPRLIIVADSLYAPDARARDPFRQRLARRRVPVIYTSQAGGVTIDFGPDAASVIPARQRESLRPLVLRLRD